MADVLSVRAVLDPLRLRHATKQYVRLCGARVSRDRIRQVWPLITRYEPSPAPGPQALTDDPLFSPVPPPHTVTDHTEGTR